MKIETQRTKISETLVGSSTETVSMVQRTTENGFEHLKEVSYSSGEIVNPNNELMTTETITINRYISKTTF